MTVFLAAWLGRGHDSKQIEIPHGRCTPAPLRAGAPNVRTVNVSFGLLLDAVQTVRSPFCAIVSSQNGIYYD